MARRSGVFARSRIGLRLRRGTLIGLGALLFGAAVALAATSPATPGGHYAGHTSQRLPIRAVVASNDAEFQGGKVWFSLHGKCHFQRFLSLSATPPPPVSINAQGHFSFRGTFAPTSSFRYTSKVMFRGHFSHSGKVLTGSGRYSASNGHSSCTSGLVTFTATRH